MQDTGGLVYNLYRLWSHGAYAQAVLLKTDFMRLLKPTFFLALRLRLAIVKEIALSSLKTVSS